MPATADFYAENIILPFNADGNVVNVENISVNLGSQIIMLAVESVSYMSLNDIFAVLDKDIHRAQVDDK
jgi:hypothetical protein